jgi:hypothetical protein
MKALLTRRRFLGAAFLPFLAGCVAQRPQVSSRWPRFTLEAEAYYQLSLPGGAQFDASGLALTPAGDLLSISDRGPTVYRIQLLPGNSAALHPLAECFTDAQLARFAGEKHGRYDCEGLARDEDGRLYLCEEADRWILRFDPRQRSVERLPIDWSPVKKYFSSDPNASFEGIAIGPGRLYVANERQWGRIIAVDRASWKVIDDFSVHPRGSNARDVHYTDLCWCEGALFVLLRESSVLLQVDPERHQVLAEYDFAEMERKREVSYRTLYPTGTMEGLAVDRRYFWLVTDNNGLGRVRYPMDIRPTLFKVRRPDVP